MASRFPGDKDLILWIALYVGLPAGAIYGVLKLLDVVQ